MKRQSILFAMAVLLSASAFAGTYSGGTGEPNDPYLIATAEDLNDIGNHPEDFNKCFLMVDDINLADYTGTQFNIIGEHPGNPFTGVFDGNDHKIWNFSFSSFGRSYIGLFSYVRSEGQIMNLGMENIDVNVVNGGYVGGLVGYNRGLISNCYATGTVTASYSSSELVEENKASNYSSTTGVLSYYHFGGLVGYNLYNGKISNCYANICVSGTGVYIGGLVGTNDGTV
jgi:hypothetical protein